MQSGFKKTSLVAIFSIVNNLLLTFFSLVYNRLIILNYGSLVAGLISTMTQFTSMFTVIEGGFSLSVIVATYKPMINGDYSELNDILFTAKKFFCRITALYTCVVLISGVIYIFFLDSPLSFLHTFLLLVLTTSTTALTIGGSSIYSVVLSGDNKQYISILISAICRIITWSISITLIIYKVNIIFVYTMNVITVVLNIFILKLYEKKKYPKITFKGDYNPRKITGIKDVMFQKIAATVFTSTDLVLVSIGLSLSKASVYNVYNQIFTGVYQYLSSLSSSPTDTFGHLISIGEMKNASEKFEIYKKTVLFISTVVFTVATVMITPFLIIYTRNIKDEEYIVSGLAIIFFTYSFFKINNLPYGMIINVSGQFKKQNIQTAVAAVVNIVSSIVFMHLFGLNGIILGSAIGTLMIIFVNIFRAKEIIDFNVIKDIFLLISNYAIGIAVVFFFEKYLVTGIENYISWTIRAIIIFLLVALIVIAWNFFVDRSGFSKSSNFYWQKINSKINKKNDITVSR